MTAGDWVLLIGLIVNAIAIYDGMRHISKKQDINHDLVNGRMSQLIDEVRASGIVKGRKDERDERERDQKEALKDKK